MTTPMANNAGDQTMVRRANELSILGILGSTEPLTLSELAAQTGLSWRSTSVVAESLASNGWLVEIDADALGQRRGRPAKRYGRRAEAGHVVGVDIGWADIRAVVADLDGTIVGTGTAGIPAREIASERVAAASTTVHEAIRQAGISTTDVWAATVATSGIIAPDGSVTKSVLFEGWDRITPGARLAQELSCPVTVLNDSTLAARAEQWRGHRSDDLIYLLAGTRLGTGMIIEGRLHRGFGGAAGEIGEIPELRWNTAVERLTSGVTAARPADAAQLVFDAARRGEMFAVAAVGEYAETLSRGLTAMILTIDPEVVVLGGEFAAAADLLLPRLSASLARTCVRTPRLEVSALGDQAVGLGAVRVALDRVEAAFADLDTTGPFTPAEIRAHLAVVAD